MGDLSDMSATITVTEAAELLGCKRSAVHRAIVAGRIHVVARDTSFPGAGRLILKRSDVDKEKKRRDEK